MSQFEVLVKKSQEDLAKLPKNGGIYMWTVLNEEGVLEPYYIGQTQDFENRFIEEFELFLGGRWFCFDPDVLKSFVQLTLKVDGREMEDSDLYKETGFIVSAANKHKSIFCHYTDDTRIQTTLKMLKQTHWVLLAAVDKYPSAILRNVEDQLITSYRKYIIEHKQKLASSKDANVPQLVHKKTGRKKHFVGDWNGNRSLQDTQSFSIANAELLNDRCLEVVRLIISGSMGI
jgi:hypothetical protein